MSSPLAIPCTVPLTICRSSHRQKPHTLRFCVCVLHFHTQHQSGSAEILEDKSGELSPWILTLPASVNKAPSTRDRKDSSRQMRFPKQPQNISFKELSKISMLFLKIKRPEDETQLSSAPLIPHPGSPLFRNVSISAPPRTRTALQLQTRS